MFHVDPTEFHTITPAPPFGHTGECGVVCSGRGATDKRVQYARLFELIRHQNLSLAIAGRKKHRPQDTQQDLTTFQQEASATL